MVLSLLIEHPKFIQPEKGKPYYSFRLRILHGEFSLAVGGWKFFTETSTLSTPSSYKGDGKFVNTCHLTPQVYNDVLATARKVFGGPEEEVNKDGGEG